MSIRLTVHEYNFYQNASAHDSLALNKRGKRKEKNTTKFWANEEFKLSGEASFEL